MVMKTMEEKRKSSGPAPARPLLPLHIQTPLIFSNCLSRQIPKAEVYMKMECSQVAGSYKIRGIGRRCQLAQARGCQRLVGSSAGNAGIALARAARLIGLPCTVYVPKATSPLVLEKLAKDNANIVLHGDNFKEATAKAMEEIDEPRVTFVPAYDHPEIWEGHSTLVDELIEQLPQKPSVIVTAVGGGGLLCGILQGMVTAGWTDVPIVAMETKGAHCFNLSLAANKRVSLDNCTSVAVTLGANIVCKELMDFRSKFNILSSVVSDAQAVYSCLQYADGERVLVEPSCGATLSSVYFGVLQKFQDEGKIDMTSGPVVLIICGGNITSLGQLHLWGDKFDVMDKKPKGLDWMTDMNNKNEATDKMIPYNN